MVKFGLSFASVLLGFASLAVADPVNEPSDHTIMIQYGVHVLSAEVALTVDQQMTGLMNRSFMPQNHGMLFPFNSKRQHCMWMKNTLIPLSVAFLDADGKVVNIEAMQPQTETQHCSIEPTVYALEANLGWFDKAGIKPGSVLKITDYGQQ